MIFKIENLEIFFKPGPLLYFRCPYVRVVITLQDGRKASYHIFQNKAHLTQLFHASHIELNPEQISTLNKFNGLRGPYKFLKYI